MEYSVRIGLLAGGPGFPYGLSHKIPPEGETQVAYSLYDAAVTPCAQQLGALAGIIDKAAAHCVANKIEESALLQDRLYPDMYCLARQIRQSADFAMNTGGRLAGVTPPAMPAVDDTSFAAAKSRVETALGFVKSLTRAQVDGAEDKVIAWKGGANDRKMKGNDYLQQFALPNFFFFVTTAYNILRHRAYRSESGTSSARSPGLRSPRSFVLHGADRGGNCGRARAAPATEIRGTSSGTKA